MTVEVSVVWAETQPRIHSCNMASAKRMSVDELAGVWQVYAGLHQCARHTANLSFDGLKWKDENRKSGYGTYNPETMEFTNVAQSQDGSQQVHRVIEGGKVIWCGAHGYYWTRDGPPDLTDLIAKLQDMGTNGEISGLWFVCQGNVSVVVSFSWRRMMTVHGKMSLRKWIRHFRKGN